jgi:hypothetical protein
MVAVIQNLAIFPDPLANYRGAEVRTRHRSEPRRSSTGEAEKLTRKAVEKALEIEKLSQKWRLVTSTRGRKSQPFSVRGPDKLMK